jgi:hypothetical protein
LVSTGGAGNLGFHYLTRPISTHCTTLAHDTADDNPGPTAAIAESQSEGSGWDRSVIGLED